MAAYFSAVMSTADSCLMASSGNVVNDLLQRLGRTDLSERRLIRLSQLVILVLGLLVIALAAVFENVLDCILYADSFMVSGLFIPTLAAYFWPAASPPGPWPACWPAAASPWRCSSWGSGLPYGLDASLGGMLLSAAVFFPVSLLLSDRQ